MGTNCDVEFVDAALQDRQKRLAERPAGLRQNQPHALALLALRVLDPDRREAAAGLVGVFERAVDLVIADLDLGARVGGAGALVFFIVIMYLVPLRLWVAAKAASAGVSIATLIAMRLRRVPPNTVVEARIAAVKAVELGAGLQVKDMTGSACNDQMYMKDGKVAFGSNHSGGITGGLTTGQDIVAHYAIKPTSSIRIERDSINKAGEAVKVSTEGRHDPCVGIRATPIAEAMLALTLIDHALRHRAQCGDVVCATPKIAGHS